MLFRKQKGALYGFAWCSVAENVLRFSVMMFLSIGLMMKIKKSIGDMANVLGHAETSKSKYDRLKVLSLFPTVNNLFLLFHDIPILIHRFAHTNLFDEKQTFQVGCSTDSEDYTLLLLSNSFWAVGTFIQFFACCYAFQSLRHTFLCKWKDDWHH